MIQKELPNTVSELLDQLDKDYPHRCLKAGGDIDKFKWYSAKRELIDHLLLRFHGPNYRRISNN